MARIAVVYLDRWANPPAFSRVFLKSISRFEPQCNYDLIWQYKGYPEGVHNKYLSEFSNSSVDKIIELEYDDKSYQFKLIFDLVSRIDYEYYLFFVSWSRILADGWLTSFVSAHASASCGIVGATGSYEHGPTNDEFPNPHIRTNGFLVRRDIILKVEAGDTSPHSSGYLLEAGPNGLTRQILRQGLKPLVVDRSGRTWEMEEWAVSRTFRSGNQEGLLIADKHTHRYDSSSGRRRLRLARRAWGDAANVPPTNPARRLRSWAAWTLPLMGGRR